MGKAERAHRRREKERARQAAQRRRTAENQDDSERRAAADRIDPLAQRAIRLLEAKGWPDGVMVRTRETRMFKPTELLGWKLCELTRGYAKATFGSSLYLLSNGLFAEAWNKPASAHDYLDNTGVAAATRIEDGLNDLIARLGG